MEGPKVLPPVSSSEVATSAAASSLCRRLSESRTPAKVQPSVSQPSAVEPARDGPTVTTLAELARSRGVSAAPAVRTSPGNGTTARPVMEDDSDAGWSASVVLRSKQSAQAQAPRTGASLASAALGHMVRKG